MKRPSFGVEFGLLVKRRRAERGLSQNDLAAALWPVPGQPKDHPRKPDISRLESGRIANPQEKTVLALCETLGIREDEVNGLRLAPPLDPYGLAKVLDNLKSASQADLYALARAFGDAEPEQRSDAALRAFLTDKAEEYANYRKLIDALDGRVAAIANLKGAAQDAAARFDFDEVENLLARVQEVELDIAAQTSEARAENALLRGRVEQAYALLSAAADSFAAIGPVECARRRRVYAERLRIHGARYGGSGLTSALELLDRHVAHLSRADHPWEWAAARNGLAITCASLGERNYGKSGAAFLARAAAACEEAFGVFTRDAHPKDWALVMQNLANVQLIRSRYAEGGDGGMLVLWAIAASEEALQVRTRESDPQGWALTTQNLANALSRMGSGIEGDAGTALLVRAVAAYVGALEVFTRSEHPRDWARTMQNLGNGLSRLALRMAGAEAVDLLARAVTSYEGVLQVYTRADDPVLWAVALKNLASTLTELGERTADEAGTALLDRAVFAYIESFQVFGRSDQPVEWANVHRNLANCNLVWARHAACDDPGGLLRQALTHVEAALTVYDPEHMPYDHDTASRLRDEVLTELAART